MSRPTDNNNNPLSLDMIDEDRVRRALGLKSSSSSTPHQQRPEQARQRHRFVADGAVPVVMLNRTDSETSGLKERLSTAEHALENERNAHQTTRRALQDASQAKQMLQTRIGHTDLSHNEVLRTEREARREAEELVVTLRAEIAQLKEAAVTAAAAAEAAIASAAAASAAIVIPAAQPVKQRREIKAIEPIIQKRMSTKEPKPVRWWTPSYRAKQQ